MSAALRIVRLAAGHLDAVHAIERSDGDVAWSREHFEKEMMMDVSRFFVLQQEVNILGYGGFWKIGDEAQITNLVIAAPERRKGRGRYLLNALLKEARKEGCRRAILEVRRSNRAAQALYRQAGFVLQSCREKVYRSPVDDAALMEKKL